MQVKGGEMASTKLYLDTRSARPGAEAYGLIRVLKFANLRILYYLCSVIKLSWK